MLKLSSFFIFFKWSVWIKRGLFDLCMMLFSYFAPKFSSRRLLHFLGFIGSPKLTFNHAKALMLILGVCVKYISHTATRTLFSHFIVEYMLGIGTLQILWLFYCWSEAPTLTLFRLSIINLLEVWSRFIHSKVWTLLLGVYHTPVTSDTRLVISSYLNWVLKFHLKKSILLKRNSSPFMLVVFIRCGIYP